MENLISSNNIHPDDALAMERNVRKQRILTIENGMKEAYWKLLQQKLQAWIEGAEKRRISLLDAGVNEKTLRILSDEKIRMETFAQVLKINEVIIYENKTWLDRFKEKANLLKEYVQTFVGYGRNSETDFGLSSPEIKIGGS